MPTSVRFIPPGGVRLRLEGADAPTELARDVVAALFAAGLQTPEPDRTGWVCIGVLDIDDQVGFLVASTGMEAPAAMDAVCRGVERALIEGLTHLRDQPPGTPERKDSP